MHGSARPRAAISAAKLPSISAGVCAFSLTSRITQRDGTAGRDAPDSRTLLYPGDRDRTGRLHRDVHGRPAACRNPGLLDDSGLVSASRPRIARGPQAPGRQPGHPGARSPSPAASRRPGRAPVHPLRRDPRSAPPPGGRSRAAGTTDGDASAPRQSRKTLSAAEPDVRLDGRRCINIRSVSRTLEHTGAASYATLA